jgi:Holliday junction DNA helicase RuvB
MNQENLLNPKVQETSEELLEGSLRPRGLDTFIGQASVKDNLKVFIKAAQTRSSVLDHVLLYGPPGLGKTSLAQIIAREMGVQFKTTSGPLLSKAADLAAIVTQLQNGDVLFIDEIHRLPAAVEEVLYPAMEDFKLDLIIGEGPSARTLNIDIAKFTLIGATTRVGLLTKPLKERFGIQLRFNFYNPEDLQLILTQAGKSLSVDIDRSAIEEISTRARGTPRVALRLLRRVIDFAHAEESNKVSKSIAMHALEKLEVDKHGLDSHDLRYLRFIHERYNSGPVGVETIAAGLSEDTGSIEEAIEPYLLQRGLINKTPRGRVLTEFAINHLRADD